MNTNRDNARFDVVVVGAGHAGCEAALAAARAGCRTLVLTPNLDRVGYMPCNPSVGGPGKAQIVAEIDALGGEMARAIDRVAVQIRELNTSKGPAVRALRAQADKLLYAQAMKEALESQPGLSLVQDEALALAVTGRGGDRARVTGVQTRRLGTIVAAAVVITAGTFLRGSMVSGTDRAAGGRAGDRADTALAGSLAELGFRLRRLKTGTPPRIDARTVDLTAGEREPGSETAFWFSRDGAAGRIEPLTLPPLDRYRATLYQATGWRPQLACLRIGTTPAAHAVIAANLHRAPMFNGSIEGVGPRYCPSIEDKVARFGDKPSHPIFLEPEGWRNGELYVQGLSTSLPPDVQEAVLAAIPALATARITRYGYAVEYDAVDPAELTPTLAARHIGGLFLAGQVNGTSGYEEAAGQGILAGLNAANHVLGRAPVMLGRHQAYIGVMVDDLIGKPFDEPYRMLTSRVEHRLLLRADTADERLAALAHDHGLISAERLTAVQTETEEVRRLQQVLAERWFAPNAASADALGAVGLSAVTRPTPAAALLRRPDVDVVALGAALMALGEPALAEAPLGVRQRVETATKYAGFIERAAREVQRLGAYEERLLPDPIDYDAVAGLRIEARQKLARHRPTTFGQARRLAGVTPADLTALMLYSAAAPVPGPVEATIS